MDAYEFLRLAHGLLQKINDEAALRTSVSRGYFSCFNHIHEFIAGLGFYFPRTADKHKLVVQDLINCGIKDAAILASDLEDLRSERNDADYEMALDKFCPNYANGIYVKACSVYRDFDKLTGSSEERKKLKRGITEYRVKIRRPVAT